MRRKLTVAAAALMTVIGASALLLAAPALGQAGSGIGACTTLTGTQDVGTVAVGQRFVLQVAPSCVFTAGAAVTVTVNGVNIPGKVATAGGSTLVTIQVVSTTLLSIDDPVLVTARCGVNSVVVTGPSETSTSGTVTQTANFTLACPGVATTPVATAITGRLSLTGANVARYGAVALALLVTGSLFVIAGRRRTPAGR